MTIAPIPLSPPAVVRGLRLGGLLLAVLLGHAAMLAAWPGRERAARTGATQGAPPRAAALAVRSVRATMTGEAAAEAAIEAAAAPRPAARSARSEGSARSARSAPEAAAAPGSPPAQPATPRPGAGQHDAPQRTAGAATAEPTAETAAAPTTAAWPTYATRLPPAAALRYQVQRGARSGQAELSWQPDDAGYTLALQMHPGAPALLDWTSEGRFDSAGLAPDRFVDRRPRQRATNFRREPGLISWSASAEQAPLLAGAQDRLSWLVQLAAIVEADPRRFGPGTSITMQVAGLRGEAEPWTFSVIDGAGQAQAPDPPSLALRREPRRPYDAVVEVWLDPQRHHLPARLRITSAGGVERLDLTRLP